MNKYKSTTLIVILSASIVSGCATIIPPPDRIHWDTAKSTSQCTDNPSEIHTQYAGSLLAAALGGWDTGTGLAAGYFPIVGIGLGAIGILGSYDADKKYEQVKQCKEFKQYALLRDSKQNKASDNSTREKLMELEKMLNDGLITDPEYKEARKKVLEGI